ncbi:hypothetical protein JCM6882_004713 [Rhodosporidiobolus microsporus]
MLERFQGATGSFNLVLSLVYTSNRLKDLKSVLKSVNSLDHTPKRRVSNASKLNPTASFPPLSPLNWLADAASNVFRLLHALTLQETFASGDSEVFYMRQKSRFHLGNVSNPRSEAGSVGINFLLSYYETESRRHAPFGCSRRVWTPRLRFLDVFLTICTLNSVVGSLGVPNCCYNPVGIVKTDLASDQ